MYSKPSNLSSDDIVQSDIKTVMDRLLDAVEFTTTSGQDNDTRQPIDKTIHREEDWPTWSLDEKDSGQHSNLQQLDDREGKEIIKQLSNPSLNIEDDADYEYSLIPMGQVLDANLRSSDSLDEINMDDVVVGLLHSSPGYSSGSSDDDDNFSSLEDARNLDGDNFLPSDPSAEDVADADEAARLVAEIEFLRLMALFVEPEPEEQGAGDTGMDPEEERDLMDVD